MMNKIKSCRYSDVLAVGRRKLPLLLTFVSIVPFSLHAETPSDGEPSAAATATVESGKGPASEKETVAATLNGKTITLRDIDRELQRPEMTAILGRAKDDPERLIKLRAGALRSIISRELLLAAARSSDKVRSESVEKEVATFVQSQGGKDSLITTLKAHGVSWEKFIEEISAGIRLKQYVEQDVAGGISIKDADVRAAFDANPERFTPPELVRARHILIQVPINAPEQVVEAARKRAEGVKRDALKPGADFIKLATELSEDEVSKNGGGDLGFFRKGMMVPEFEKVAFALKPGDISDPIKTQFGFHIVKVEEHKAAEKPNYEASKKQVLQFLEADARNKALMARLESLRSGAHIEVLLPELRGEGAPPPQANAAASPVQNSAESTSVAGT